MSYSSICIIISLYPPPPRWEHHASRDLVCLILLLIPYTSKELSYDKHLINKCCKEGEKWGRYRKEKKQTIPCPSDPKVILPLLKATEWRLRNDLGRTTGAHDFGVSFTSWWVFLSPCLHFLKHCIPLSLPWFNLCANTPKVYVFNLHSMHERPQEGGCSKERRWPCLRPDLETQAAWSPVLRNRNRVWVFQQRSQICPLVLSPSAGSGKIQPSWLAVIPCPQVHTVHQTHKNLLINSTFVFTIWKAWATTVTISDPPSWLFSPNNAYLEMSQTYFYNLLWWDRPNSKVHFILKTHTQNKWNSCLPSLKNDQKKKFSQIFLLLFILILPVLKQSSWKGKFSNFDLSQDTFFYTEVLFLTVSTCDLF